MAYINQERFNKDHFYHNLDMIYFLHQDHSLNKVSFPKNQSSPYNAYCWVLTLCLALI